MEILARQRARDSCEVRASVRKGEEREEEEVEKAEREEEEVEREEEEVEKARREEDMELE